MKKSLLILLLFNSCMLLKAQDTLSLNLEKSIDIALKRSVRINQLKANMEWAEYNLWAAKAGYRTQINSSFFAPAYNEGFRVIDVEGETSVVKQFGEKRFQGQLDITQPLPWIPLGGADLTFRSSAYQLNDWIPDPQNLSEDKKSSKFYSSLSLIVNKPLFTINQTALGLERARLSFEQQSSYFKRSELDLVFNVTQQFYLLYSLAEQVKIDEDKVQRQEAIYETTKNKYQVGLIAEVDAMQAEVDLIGYKNDLKQTRGSYQEQLAVFNQLLDLSLDQQIDIQIDMELKSVYIDETAAVQHALKNRLEIDEHEIDIAEQKINIRTIDDQVSIQGNLRGYYDLAGFSDSALPYGTSTRDLFDSSWETLKETPNRGFTFELEVPIFDWGRNKAQVNAARAQLKGIQLRLKELQVNIQREVKDAVRKVYETWDRVQMLEKSRSVSERSYLISVRRFENGDITSTDLARANDQYNATKMAYLSAYVEYQLSLADLRRKTLYDFEISRPLVKDDNE